MIGKTLGQYEIQSLLGQGGMGEVYRARDTRLGRTVAVKILPKATAQDRERMQRFEREARLLASLNHTNIATLFGFEQFEGLHFLVMEFVDGPTLAERIARGPIPVAEALAIARQIAEALEAAHEKGVIHRDLKPANVKITPDGKVKVLDFGLAKALTAPTQGDLLSSPTMSVGGTYAGVVLGTAPYMSPEQAKGQEVDQRADVFAFGCVLFEMLTGRRAFQGDTVTDAIASVLARDPDMTTLPAGIHPRLHEILKRCLEKDQKRRWQAIGDLRVELEVISADPHGLKVPSTTAAPVPLWKFVVPAVITGVFAVAITAAAFWSLRPAPPTATVTRFSFTLPKDQSFTRTGRHVIAISPDGANVVYVANNQLYLKSMAEMDAKPIAGTALDVDTPVFSPDGKWIAFCAVPEGKLKKIAITGGTAVTLADIGNPYGAQWTTGDQILVGQGPKGIVRIPANGGKAETVVAVKSGEFAASPQLLPDGAHLLFTLAAGGGDERWDKGQIVIQSLTSDARTTVVTGGSDARYVPSGHVVYALGPTVFALPFDIKALHASGGPVPVLDGMSRGAVNTGAAFFAFSDNGSLAFIPGGLAGGGSSVSLAFVSRKGEKTPLNLPPQPYFQPRISPDGRQLAVEVFDNKDRNIWVYDLSGAASIRRLTFGGKNFQPIWTRDGQRVVFTSDREGDSGLFWQRADGSGAAERLTSAEAGFSHAPESWSPDGVLVFVRYSTNAARGLWTLPINGDRKSTLLVEPPTKSSFADESAFSPDGRWFVYEAGDTTDVQVYVQPFPPTGAKYQISTRLASDPVWSPDGKQIIYLDRALSRSALAVVDVRTQPSFAVGTPTPLPVEGFVQRGGRPYDITPDGKQFIVMLPPSETKSGETLQINVVLNWFQDLKQRAPAK
jgi:eukaryotic-like serine/threonine-protein kinase